MQETQEMRVQSLDGEDPLEEDMATHDLLEYWLTCFSYEQLITSWIQLKCFWKLTSSLQVHCCTDPAMAL